MSACPSGTLITPLAALNRLPGWLGTLVISPDGSVLQSAGELVNGKDLAQRFAAIANRVGRLLSLESEKQTPQFRRLTIHYTYSTYLMTCVGDTIYVVKRANDNPMQTPSDLDNPATTSNSTTNININNNNSNNANNSNNNLSTNSLNNHLLLTNNQDEQFSSINMNVTNNISNSIYNNIDNNNNNNNNNNYIDNLETFLSA